MKLFYDNLIYSLQRVGGISVYWYELTKRLLSQQDIDLYFYETGLEKDNLLRALLDIETSQIIKSKRINLTVERFLSLPSAEDKNIFHSSYFRIPEKSDKTKIVTTIHDFTHDLYYSGPRVWLHNTLKKKAIEKSDVVITVSENTRNDLIKFYPDIDKEKVKTIYNGVSEDFYVISGLNYDLIEPYILFIGSREHYKNFNFAVNLASVLKGYKLYVVGAPFNKEESKFVHSFLGNRVKVFSGIDNQELNRLYNQASFLLYPSSYEGFGIPLVEAMRAGCPFIALNASSIPEVAGEAGILLDNLNIEMAVEAAENISKNREDLVQKGKVQSEKFSWDSCFENTYNLYKNIE